MKKIMAIFAALIAATTMSMDTSAMTYKDKTNEVFSIEEEDVTTYGVGRLGRVVQIYKTYNSEKDFVCVVQINETEEKLEVEVYLDGGSYLSIYAY